MALQFIRDAKIYIVDKTDASAPYTAWQVGVLDGFSFSQSINSSEITVNEAGDVTRRARLLFNDSLAPVEWSMSTYMRPTTNTNVRCPEEALWGMLLGATSGDSSTGIFVGRASPDEVNATNANTNTFNFSQSNYSSMGDDWDIVVAFVPPSGTAQYYTLSSSVVNSATIDFDIEGIATIQWSGFARSITDNGSSAPPEIASAITTGLNTTDNFIRNRISTVSLVRTDTSPDETYNVILTGGSFTIENNITYLTPEELGIVNQPLANVTGTRSISGNLTCYLDTGAEKSAALFANLVADNTTVRNVFDMAINIGGEADNNPRVTLDLPTAHLEIPSIGVEDLLTLDIAFHGQVSGGNVDSTNEATIIYAT